MHLSVERMSSYTQYIELNDGQIQEIVDGLTCTSNDCGLVLIAENLNKLDERATYLVVFFNANTKEIIYSKRASGKGFGFGVRNHWAGSIYRMLKNWRY